MRIFLVEDDTRLRQSLVSILTRNGYQVDTSSTYVSGFEDVFLSDYDLIILDWMLPDGNGVDLCKEIRNEGLSTPILILTAKSMVEDIETGLDSGADDYLTKPFEMIELLARIRALLRRKDTLTPDIFELDTLKINFLEKSVFRSSKEITLSPKELATLELLARNSHKVLSRDEIFSKIWDSEDDMMSNTVDVYISFLRKKVDTKDQVPLIKTIKGVGYRLCKN